MPNIYQALLILQVSLALTPAREIALRDVPPRKGGKPRHLGSIQAREIDNAREAVLSLDEGEYAESYALLQALDDTINELISSHFYLAINISDEYASSVKGMRQDLYSEARIGLLRAAKRWTIPNKISFTVYAEWWVRAQLKRAVSKLEPTDDILMDNVLEFDLHRI
jgi:DNA-directed RNA polymerase sigma subunit (sigma70/sigma32)